MHRLGTDTSVSVLAGAPSPTWFGPHPILLLIDHDGRQLVIHERLRNDGARISADNFPASLKSSQLVVCLRAQEQADVQYVINLAAELATEKHERSCSAMR